MFFYKHFAYIASVIRYDMIKVFDIDRGEIYLNINFIVSIEQQIRDCKVLLADGSIFYTAETDTEIINLIKENDAPGRHTDCYVY